MIILDLLEFRCCRVLRQRADVPEHRSAGPSRFGLSAHLIVDSRIPDKKSFGEFSAPQYARDEIFHLNLIEIHLPAELPSEDEELAGDIPSREIIPSVRLGEAMVVCVLHDRAERNRAV